MIQSLERTVDEVTQLEEAAGTTQDGEDRSAPEQGSRSDEERDDPEGTIEIGKKRTDSGPPRKAAKSTLEVSEPLLVDPKLGNPISHIQVIDLSRKLKAQGLWPRRLDTLLSGARVYVAPPPPKSEPVSSTTIISLQNGGN